MFILYHFLSGLSLEMTRPPSLFDSSSFPDFESLADEMELLSLLREVSGSYRLHPACVNHLQSVSPFHFFDFMAEIIEKCLMSVDDMRLRPQSLFVVVLKIFQREEL